MGEGRISTSLIHSERNIIIQQYNYILHICTYRIDNAIL